MKNLHLAIFGGNLALPGEHPALQGACRLLRTLGRFGCRLTFYQPDLLGRRSLWRGRDPEGGRMVFYPTHGYIGLFECLEEAATADVIIKFTGAGAYDHLLDTAVLEVRKPSGITVFLDLDPHATLNRLRCDPADPLLSVIPEYDLVLTTGGGAPLLSAFLALGARECMLLWSTLDPSTRRIVPPDPQMLARHSPGVPVSLEHAQAVKHAFEQCLAQRREPATEAMAAVH